MTDFVFETFSDSGSSTREKTRWLEYSFGTHVVRLLSAPTRVFTHFVRGKGTVECLGRDCPICKRNHELEASYGKEARQQPNYLASTARHYANVLDRTFVKICPQCGVENKKDILNQFSNTCACGTIIATVDSTRSNTVKVANISETNAKALMALRSGVLDDEGNPRGLGTFDIAFLVTSSNGKKNIAVSATNNVDVVTAPEEQLYDTTKLVIKLEPPEMVQFINGVALKDLFAGRTQAVEAKADAGFGNMEFDAAARLKELGF